METSEQALAQVVQNVLETMAFAFVMSSGEAAPADGEEVLTATVRFDGAEQGWLALTAPQAIMPEVGANMLGLEGEPCPPEQQRDALGELANVIAGNALCELFGPKTVFDLAKPDVTEVGPPAETPPDACRRAVRLELDEGWVTATLILDRADALQEASTS